jgi:hypothetical protein
MEGQRPEDRPDLCARVFNLKSKQMIDDIKKGALGRMIAHIHVIEYQKRGLPHMHLLCIAATEDRLRTADQVDTVISAELPPDPMTFPEGPQREQAERLQHIVTANMIHGPCAAMCWESIDRKVCSKHFPKPFAAHTVWDSDQCYPTYRRRNPDDGGRQMQVRGREIDNSWVVPYSPYFCLKYDCHINVEFCASPLAAKYLFKYVYKGSDRAMVSMSLDPEVCFSK